MSLFVCEDVKRRDYNP